MELFSTENLFLKKEDVAIVLLAKLAREMAVRVLIVIKIKVAIISDFFYA